MELLPQARRKHPFAVLFYSLLLTIAAAPAAHLLDLEVLQFFLFLNLLAAAWGASSGRLSVILNGLVIVFAATAVARWLGGGRFFTEIGQAVFALAGASILVGALRRALRRGPVDRERIYAALTAYVLAGLVFSTLYLQIDERWPASFAMFGNPVALEFSQATYFSFVTLTSLGYGDIVPVSELARSVAVLEVISGQLYLVVLVARLVSLYVSEEPHSGRS